MFAHSRSILLVALFATGLTRPVFASPPPPKPPYAPAPAAPAAPLVPPQLPPAVPVVQLPITPEVLRASSLSPTMVNAFIASMTPKTSEAADTTSAGADVSTIVRSRHEFVSSPESSLAFVARPDTSVSSARTLTCCDDAVADREVSFTINPVGVFGSEVLYNYTAFMTRDANSYRVRTSDASGSSYRTVANGSAGDPMLAATYVDASFNPNIVAPNRVYLVHTDFSAATYAPN